MLPIHRSVAQGGATQEKGILSLDLKRIHHDALHYTVPCALPFFADAKMSAPLLARSRSLRPGLWVYLVRISYINGYHGFAKRLLLV